MTWEVFSDVSFRSRVMGYAVAVVRNGAITHQKSGVMVGEVRTTVAEIRATRIGLAMVPSLASVSIFTDVRWLAGWVKGTLRARLAKEAVISLREELARMYAYRIYKVDHDSAMYRWCHVQARAAASRGGTRD